MDSSREATSLSKQLATDKEQQLLSFQHRITELQSSSKEKDVKISSLENHISEVKHKLELEVGFKHPFLDICFQANT